MWGSVATERPETQPFSANPRAPPKYEIFMRKTVIGHEGVQQTVFIHCPPQHMHVL